MHEENSFTRSTMSGYQLRDEECCFKVKTFSLGKTLEEYKNGRLLFDGWTGPFKWDGNGVRYPYSLTKTNTILEKRAKNNIILKKTNIVPQKKKHHSKKKQKAF